MIIQRPTCQLCGKQFKQITHTHLSKAHGMSLKEYMIQFPDAPLYEGETGNNGKELLLDSLRRNWS